MDPAPRVLPAPPRNVRFTNDYIRTRSGFAVFAGLVALVVLIAIFALAKRRSELIDRGVVVEATVRYREHGNRRSSTDELALDFVLEGRRDSVTTRIDESDRLDLQPLTKTNLWVDPNDLENFKLTRPTRRESDGELIKHILGWMAGVIVLCIGFWIERIDATENLTRLRDYEEAAFKVTSIHVTSAGKTTSVTADGIFIDQRGTLHNHNGLTVTGTMHVADSILILYNPDKPSEAFPVAFLTRVEVV